jgi:hypothetical protein
METQTYEERIVEALALVPGEWRDEYDLLVSLVPRRSDTPGSPPRHDEAAFREANGALAELVRSGVVGRSYMHEDLGDGCVGRVYYVWLKTPETAESDRELEQLDREWAAVTGGLFERGIG